MSSTNAISSPASSTDSVYTVHNLDYFYTDFTAEELAIFTPTPIMSMIDLIDSFPTIPTDVPMASTASIGTPTPSPTLSKTRLIEPLPETTTVDESIIPIETHLSPPPAIHQYPPTDIPRPSQPILHVRLRRVTLRRTHVTVPDFQDVPVYSLDKPPYIPVRAGMHMIASFSTYRIKHEIRSNTIVTLYECQDIGSTPKACIILAVPTPWTLPNNVSRRTKVAKYLQMFFSRVVYNLTQCIRV
jgi:hypothetical protein